MAETKPGQLDPIIVGCTDIYALNYSITATLACPSCCIYTPSTVDIIGCMDRLATNYNPLATKPCNNCCRYDKPTNPTILGPSPQPQPQPQPQPTTFPYNVNPDGANCIRDIELFNTNWTQKEGGYGEGYLTYRDELEQIVAGSNPPYTPNWGSNGSMAQIWSAFDVLLLNKPNHRVYLNNYLLTPWIIPLYSNETPLTTNPNQEQFIRDCNQVGGEMYIYEEGGNTTLTNLKKELNTAEEEYNQSITNYTNYQTYLTSLVLREPTLAELNELDRLKNETVYQSKLLSEIQNNVKTTTNNKENKSYVKNHFMACLCSSDNTIEPVKCKTTSIKGDTIVITPTRAECVKDYETFINFLNQSLNPVVNGLGTQTTFFNTVVLTELGISQDDARFIIENYWNYSPAYYPYNSSILDSVNGSTRSREIIKNAFLNGGNIWLPISADIATDIIWNKECCDLVGGIYKEGSYQPNPPNKDTKTSGVCLCNEIKEPCPTFSDGTAVPQVETITDRGGGTITTTYVSVSEDCCSNSSLQSKMVGEWTWVDGRCILVNEENTNACDNSTIITISETPISVDDVDCVDRTVTVTAYIYFEEPNNKCTDGILVENTAPLTNDIVSLYKNQPLTPKEVSKYSVEKDWESETKKGNGAHTEQPQSTNCCYDTNTPITGLLILQDINNVKIDTPLITYIDTFSSTSTTINTNVNVGGGFGRWVKLTTVVDIDSLPTSTFNVAVEFTQGLFKCCDYNIFFDDIQVGCLQSGVREIYNTEQCPGFKLRHVIDNKKSWVYNPGTNVMSDSRYDNNVRDNGTLGMNIAQSNPNIIDGGHGAINRVFAPSVDAELPFRDTDYFGFHGVIEKHSKLVLNSKEVILQFNMCPDSDCVIDPSFLVDDYGNYILDDDGGKIIVGQMKFPNLLELETFKKTFQGFWIQFMEQFIPATTIFVSGEKWCNSRICDEMLVSDYLLDATNNNGVLSPLPTNSTPPDILNTPEPNTRIQTNPINGTIGSSGPTIIKGNIGSTNNGGIGPIIVGNTKIYSLEALDPEKSTNTKYRNLL